MSSACHSWRLFSWPFISGEFAAMVASPARSNGRSGQPGHTTERRGDRMATAVVARPVARPQARARDEEVLVWPDLVFIEFISAMLFTVTLFILSVVINAPLLDQANADVTPNPSKAPWYLLNLQELLLHMNAAMAGII